MATVNLSPREVVALASQSGLGKHLVQISGLPDKSEAMTTDHLRDLAERLYQIADQVERGKQIITLRY